MSDSFHENSSPPPLPTQDANAAQPAPQRTGPPPVPVLPCAQEEIERHPFSLSKANLILFGIALAYCVIGFMAKRQKTAYEMGQLAGQIIIILLVSTLIGWIAWRSSGRKKHGGSLACSIAIFVLLFSQTWPSPYRREENPRQILAGIERKKAEFQREAANTDDPSELESSRDEYVDSVTNDLRRISEASTGPEKPVLKITSQFNTETVALARIWRDSFKAVQSPDILDYSLLSSDEEFDRQRRVIRLYVAETKAYSEFYANMVPTLTKRLSALRRGNPHVKAVIEGARESYLSKKPIFEPLMQTHIDCGGNLIQVLDLLQKNRNQWSYENGELLINSDSVRRELNRLFDLLRKNEETIDTLATKLLRSK